MLSAHVIILSLSQNVSPNRTLKAASRGFQRYGVVRPSDFFGPSHVIVAGVLKNDPSFWERVIFSFSRLIVIGVPKDSFAVWISATDWASI